jgi:hypothetical protein
MMQKLYHNVGFWEKRHFFAENCDHSIDPWSHLFDSSLQKSQHHRVDTDADVDTSSHDGSADHYEIVVSNVGDDTDGLPHFSTDLSWDNFSSSPSMLTEAARNVILLYVCPELHPGNKCLGGSHQHPNPVPATVFW